MQNNKIIVSPIIVILVNILFIVTCIFFSIELYIAFFVGIIFTSIVLYKSGYSMNLIKSSVFKALIEAKNLSAVIFLIGATTSIWLSSGVVPTIMYYGFNYMKDINFLLASFLITVLISIFMGTAVGTISTIGISLFGIGVGMGIPKEIMTGVLISGAFMSDKISPLSGLVNLSMTSIQRTYKEIVKGMLVTLIPTIIICGIIYYIIGLNYKIYDYTNLLYYQKVISDYFNTSPILLFLPVAILILSIVGIKPTRVIFIGLIIGSIFSIMFQKISIIDSIKNIFLGYNGNTASEELNKMLVSGGMVSMISVVFVVIGGIILVRLLEEGNILMPVISKLILKADSKLKLIIITGLISMIVTSITCDQAVGIILTAKVLSEKYEEYGLDNVVLARTVSDTGTIIAPLISWNVNAFIIKPIFDISTSEYFLYSVLCYIFPIVTFISAFLLYKKNNKKLHITNNFKLKV